MSRSTVLDAVDHGRGHLRLVVDQSIPGARSGGELGAGDEQLALEAQDEFGESAEACGCRTPYWALIASSARAWPRCGDGFVDGAVCLGPEVVLPDAVAAVEKAGRAVVALAGGDLRIKSARWHSAVPITTSVRRRADPSAPREA